MLNPYGAERFRLSSPQGQRILDGVNGVHNGIDLVGEGGKQIFAVKGGTVVRSRMVTNKSDATWQWGNYIAVQGNDGKLAYYCHLSQRLVREGQTVTAGDLIGIEGSTGYSTGSHLHLEIREGTRAISASEYTGIPNKCGVYGGVSDYAALVAAKCSFSQETVKYLSAHPFADDLWRKLWTAMR